MACSWGVWHAHGVHGVLMGHVACSQHAWHVHKVQSMLMGHIAYLWGARHAHGARAALTACTTHSQGAQHAHGVHSTVMGCTQHVHGVHSTLVGCTAHSWGAQLTHGAHGTHLFILILLCWPGCSQHIPGAGGPWFGAALLGHVEQPLLRSGPGQAGEGPWHSERVPKRSLAQAQLGTDQAPGPPAVPPLPGQGVRGRALPSV